MENKKVYGKDTFSITFGDQAENQVGMQKIGVEAKQGFTKGELIECFKKVGEENCEFIDLDEKLPKEIIERVEKCKKIQTLGACVLIIR